MPNSTDGRYDYTKPWVTNTPSEDAYSDPQPTWTYNGPWASNMERLTQQALMAATMPRNVLQDMVVAPLPQIRLFPSRFGFGIRLQPEIDDVVSLDRVYTEPRVSWYSGSPAGFSGADRNSLETL
jgi:hypothetical protein